MDNLLFTAVSGAQQAQQALNVRANNLANVGTNGFRAEMAVAESAAVEGYGYDTRHQARLAENALIEQSGSLTDTGRPLDAAINGEGYFAIDTDDGVAYTRGGSFTLDEDGNLLSGGHPLLGQGGGIVLPPHDQVKIGEDGSVSVLANGQTQWQTIDTLLLVRPDQADLHKNQQGLLVSRTDTDYVADANVRVAPGHIEGSNVVAVEEMMQTMQLSREFDLHMRVFRTAQDMADSGNRLIRG